MRYLMRESSLLTPGQWEQIDKAVVAEAKGVLAGRRFLAVAGPYGAQAQNVPLDMASTASSAAADFWGKKEVEAVDIMNRRFLPLISIYADFMISWRDIENENGAGVQAAIDATEVCARREDDLIFHGDADFGIEGIFTAKGTSRLPIADWSEGEAPLMDVAKAVETLVNKGCSGERVLLLATDLYAKLHRIQPGTGLMEIDRLRGLVGKVIHSPRIEKGKAALAYCDPQNMDLVIGQDMITAYLGNEKLDHAFRVMETLVPRIKRPSAIAILG